MIVVTIELRSARTGKCKQLGRAVISNDGMGSPKRGNYRWSLYKQGRDAFASGEIKDFPRKSYHVWELVRRVLNDALRREGATQ